MRGIKVHNRSSLNLSAGRRCGNSRGFLVTKRATAVIAAAVVPARTGASGSRMRFWTSNWTRRSMSDSFVFRISTRSRKFLGAVHAVRIILQNRLSRLS